MVDTKSKKDSPSLPAGVNLEQINTAVKALTKFAAKSKEDSLFLDAPTRLLMDVVAMKTPSGKDHFFNIRLSHTPHPDLSNLDVLLVVPDVPEKDPDHVVGEYRDELLNSANSEKIKVREVMTFTQFRDDYSTYEAKKALVKSVDVVVAENKIRKMIPGVLGREFMKKKKFPMFIPGRKFKKEDLASQIWFALHKTTLNLSLKGRVSTVVVGHDSLTEEQLSDNVKSIVLWLQKAFPGGWNNIEKLSLHIGEKSMPPLPIYFSTGSRNAVTKRPRTKGGPVKEEVEGEVSTQLGKRIKISSTGKIEVIKSEDRDELDDIL